ncbi:MAG: cyclase family protein [Thermoplasmataceae archaeon]
MIDKKTWNYSKIIDITWKLNENTPIYPGDSVLSIENIANKEKPYINLSKITMGSHTGTHMDAPYHMVKGGFKSDMVPLENLIGPVVVVETHGKKVYPEDIPENGYSRILFKTEYEPYEGEFRTNFSSISRGASEKLVQLNFKLVGIDYLSIDEYNFVEPVAHWALLGKGITVIEALNLRHVEPGEYFLVVLPLNISADGAPCRAILFS